MLNVFGWITTAAAAVMVWSAPAQANVGFDVQGLQMQAIMEAQALTGIEWKVGDKTSHKIAGGFINGKSETYVREDIGTSLWLQNDLDLGFLGKQKIEILINKTTGQIEKMIANGQEQQVPEVDPEVLEMKEDKIKVTAGEFDCIYVKVLDRKSNQTQEAWINPQAVPMSGNIKSMSDSQLGKITQELTAFSFAPR